MPDLAPGRAASRFSQFSLETLMLVMTLVAICLGICTMLPPLGIPVSLVAAGALVRTCCLARRLRGQLRRFTWREKLYYFVTSSATVVGGVVVAVLTFMTTGFLGGMLSAVFLRPAMELPGPGAGMALVALILIIMGVVISPLVTMVVYFRYTWLAEIDPPLTGGTVRRKTPGF